MAIPAAALKLCGFENGDKAELHALPSAAIILKQKMTAMEVIQAMDALHQLTVDLSVHLARASGPCDGCDGDCPFDGLDGQEIALPDYLRDEAGIPENAKLCAYVDEEENTVTIAEAGYDHDLRDVRLICWRCLPPAGSALENWRSALCWRIPFMEFNTGGERNAIGWR